MKELFPFQTEDVQKAHDRNTLIGSECGIGKTIEAIEIVRRRRDTHSAKGPVLVLCTKRAKTQWFNEILVQDPNVPIFVTGQSGVWPDGPENEIQLKHLFEPRHNSWVIAHHEALSLPKSKHSKAWRRRKYKAPLVWNQWMWEAIILDEAHRFKDRRSSRSMWLRQLDAAYYLALTGTPMEKSPADMWALLNWLHPRIFASYWNFFEEFVEYEHPWIHGRPRRDIRTPIGTKNGDKLAKLIDPIFIRRTKKEVRPDIPPNVQHTFFVTLDRDERQYKLYREIAKAKDIEVDLQTLTEPERIPPLLVPNVLAKIVRLQQCLADPRILNVNAPSAKLEWIQDYVKDNPHEPIVIFTKFRHTAKVISDLIDAQLAIGGTPVPGADVVGVHAPPSGRLVGTIKYIGQSLNLQWASTAIFVTPEWSTIDMIQALDRIHRIDIQETKHTIFLEVPRTVDGLVHRALRDKWSQQELVYHFIKGDANGWE